MRKILPHIAIGLSETGGIDISVEDAELFDYVDDHLTEQCNVEYEWCKFADPPGSYAAVMHFAETYSLTQLETHLLELPREEVERIYAINN